MRAQAKPSILQVCAVDFTAWHFLLPLARAQRAAGFQVEFACAPGSYVPQLVEQGFPVFPIPFQRNRNLRAHARAYRRLKALCRRRQFTVVHTHTPVASLIARPASRRAGVPIVLYTAHGFYFHERMHPLARRLHIGLERWAQRYADHLFTQSREDCETALLEGIAPADRAEAIGNGVDLERFRPGRFDAAALAEARGELGLEESDGPIIMTVGRLVREKGYFELLDALAEVRPEFPRMRALLVGDALASDHDDSAAAIRRRAKTLGLQDAVVFTGLTGDVPRLLALADLFCLPSWREGMPRTILEAMASGLPVVTTDIRGCREEVLDGRTGMLSPPRESRALAAALRRMLGDDALRRQMGQCGLARAREAFDERQVIERQMIRLRRLFSQKELRWPE